MGQAKTSTQMKLDQNELQKLEHMFDNKQYQELDCRLEQHIQNNPDAFFLYNIKGLSQSAQRHFREAVDCYRKVLEFQPDHASAYNNIGTACMNLGNFEEAVENFENALKYAPDMKGIFKNIGIAYNNLEKFEDAIKYYRKALAQNQTDPVIYRNLGIAHDNLQQFEEAQNYYNKALEIAPEDIETLQKYSTSLLKSNHNEAAVNLLKNGLLQFPDNYELHVNAGAAYNNSGQYDIAITHFEKAIKLNPKAISSYTNIASALINIDRVEEAINYYDQALEHAPDQTSLYYLKGKAYSQIGRDKPALDCYSKTTELEPGNAQAWFYKGFSLMQLEQPDAAIPCYEKAIQVKPDFINAYINMATSYRTLGDGYKAAQIYQQAIELDENSDLALRYFAETTRTLNKVKLSPLLRKHIILCLRSPRVASIAVNPITNMLLQKDLQNHLSDNEIATSTLTSLHEKTEGLLSAYLKNSIFTDFELEKFCSKVRSKICELYLDNNKRDSLNSETILPIIQAMAFQGDQNEYIWYTTDKDTLAVEEINTKILDKIASGNTPDPLSIYLLASFRPLSTAPEIREWGIEAYENAEEPLKELLRKQIIEPAREQEISETIECITSIDDDISSEVRNQYEENPYPRWDTLTSYISQPYINRIKHEIEPNQLNLVATTTAPEVLVAGCGTGKHPISLAMQYENSNILAVDLSKASLSYANRKANEMGLNNISFGQADILKLKELKRTFDLIECCGVLHHMENPEAGLKVLLSLLKPGGYIKIALYSEIARSAIAKLREQITPQEIDTSIAGIQKFRHNMQETVPDIHKDIFVYNDFFSTSTFRDLLLHVQEHRFTLPQIASLLEKHSLSFLGFDFRDPRIKLSYKQMFPEDANATNLDNWNEFEKINPQTFIGMYTFWCQPH